MKSFGFMELKRDEYDEIWDRFEDRFAFKPNYYEQVIPAINEPPGSITYTLAPEFNESALKQLNAVFLGAYRLVLPKGQWLYRLDWQHQSYKLDLHASENEQPLAIYPDGDYYITLTEDMNTGTFGHPWQQSVCVFGDELVKHIRANTPSIFTSVIRHNA